jgi:hypothetical protein
MRTLVQRLSPRIAEVRKLSRRLFLPFWSEHGVALLLYAVLAIGLSWPAVQSFTTRLLGHGGAARHRLWMLWHTREWVLGGQALFSTDLLYYPQGIPLPPYGVGPVMGLMALPFWGLGPEAAYNGALLIGVWLTGYCMYLLARGLGMDRGIALFAGVVLQASPPHLAGLSGDIEKTFVVLPLVLLTLHHALNPERSAGWSVATALTLLLTALHSGQMFVFSALAVVFFLLAEWLSAQPGQRGVLLKRGGLLVMSIVALVGPLLVTVARAPGDPQLLVDGRQESAKFSPDLAAFFLPPYYSAIGGSVTRRLVGAYAEGSPGPYLEETAVSLLWTGVALGILAWKRGPRSARRWLVFAMCGIIVSLGPHLHAFGQTAFTEYELPITLPYAALTALPGLGFMRDPGRMMIAGYVGLAVAGAYGLTWLVGRFPRHRWWVLPLATVLILLQAWPRPWQQELLPPAPAFYGQIAGDAEVYGVLDLPFKPTAGIGNDEEFVDTSSVYQVYQMTHQKGIAAGCASRTYRRHPFLANLQGCAICPEIGVNSRVLAKCGDIPTILAGLGYRYVVWHRTLFPGSPGQMTAEWFVETVFSGQVPVVEDEWVTVYRLPLPSEAVDAGALESPATSPPGSN